MARPLRIEYPGAVYHITSRGNEKKLIFKDEEDREIFLDTLSQVDKRYNWLCHAYCLMNNHYHLIIETPDGNLSAGMRQLNGVYTQTFNRQYNRVGHLFQGRYKGILIQKDSHSRSWGQAFVYAFILFLTLCNVLSPSLISPILANRDRTEISRFNIACKSIVLYPISLASDTRITPALP